MGEFQHGLCGCFDNFGLCLLTYFVPCYTFGKNAEAVGDSCCLCGLAYFVPIVDLVALVTVRGKIRESRNIEGGCCTDLLTIIFCHLCALVQEAQEVQAPGGVAMARS
ncbi:cell number regulator 13 [Plakobranchus ocellatus]|uniref:Cell number regulator 13 n=1 Tax=Plakobranchus ocellatus TaxID=259542 RepID=A0AAV3ZJP5_9GAST|nr:cell number regulator 13 [Plakobranchus ocellatus]